MSLPLSVSDDRHVRSGIEMGFFLERGRAIVYDGTEPVAIDAQAGKGKLARFLGVNLVSPRTAHLTKIVTDPKDAELAWVSWKTLEREGYRVRFINPGRLYGYPSESFNINTKLLDIAARPDLSGLVWDAAYDAASYLVPVDPNPAHRWIGQGVRTAFATYYRRAALHPSPRCIPRRVSPARSVACGTSLGAAARRSRTTFWSGPPPRTCRTRAACAGPSQP